MVMGHESQTGGVSLETICAVLCNYARPKSTRLCVRRLLDLGVSEIIVWNNGAEPIPEATHNIVTSKNIGPIGKHLGALQTTRPYVLILDDDHLLTPAGLDALRTWVFHYPAVAQQGGRFKPPFRSYRRQKMLRSQKIELPEEVDMLMPNKGMMLKTSLYRM